MIKILLKIVAALLLIALAILAFIKLLPWAFAIIVLLALVKFTHDWLCRHGVTPAAWWPWQSKPDDGPQNAA